MTGWGYLDPANGQVFDLPVGGTNFDRDFTWMGIRKGGTRWFSVRLAAAEALVVWQQRAGSFLYFNQPIPAPAGFGGFQVHGITNDKHRLVMIGRDTTGAVPDSLIYYDTAPNLIVSFVLSNVPERRSSQIVFMEHDYLVIQDVPGPNILIVRYDGRGQLVRTYTIPLGGLSSSNIQGITTDGKHLYIVSYTVSAGSKIRKLGFKGNSLHTLRDYAPPTGTYFEKGVTFEGRYLIVATKTIPPG